MYDAFVGILPRNRMRMLRFAKITCPLGLVSIATAIVRRNLPALVMNDELTPERTWKEDLRQWLAGKNKALVGLTLLAGNVGRAKEIADWVATLGHDVVVGGPEVTLETAPYYANVFGAAVLGPAHTFMPELMQTGFNARRPNMFMRDQPNPLIMPSSFDMTAFEADYFLVHRLAEDYEGVSYQPGIGCPCWKDPCYFCGRQWRGNALRDPAQVWRELEGARQAGLGFFYGTMDSVNRALPALLATRPSGFVNTTHKLFINATQVNDDTACQLKELGGLVTIGIESLTRIATAEKGRTGSAHNYQAIRTLARHGVQMVLTFVLGLPGESEETLEREGAALMELLREYGGHVHSVFLSPLLMTIGSKAWQALIRHGYIPSSKVPGEYYDPLAASERHAELFCSANRTAQIQHLAKMAANIRSLNQTHGYSIRLDAKGLKEEEAAMLV